MITIRELPGFKVLKPVRVSVRRSSENCYVASFDDANIYASGETKQEAAEMWVDMLRGKYQLLEEHAAVGRLGKSLKEDLGVLREYVRPLQGGK